VAAQAADRLKTAFNKYLKPRLLLVDEVGYLPIDKTGADLLFQIVSHRYERASMIITSNGLTRNGLRSSITIAP
jgi:DNA replication protein DnaC